LQLWRTHPNHIHTKTTTQDSYLKFWKKSIEFL
jgi:hypothetical protein